MSKCKLLESSLLAHLDAVEVDVEVLKLLQQKEAAGHALPARDSVTLTSASTHQLEVLLCHLKVLSAAHHLPNVCIHYSLQDVLLLTRNVVYMCVV
jgi:hypothetical protein